METKKELIEAIKIEKDMSKMFAMQKKLNELTEGHLKNRCVFVLSDIVPKGYKLTCFHKVNQNVYEALFTKGFLRKNFICIASGNYSVTILKIIDTKRKYTYQINGQSGKNTKFIQEIIL